MKLDHAHQRTISESYEQLPSHSHLAKNIESGGYFPAGRRKTEPGHFIYRKYECIHVPFPFLDTSDYHMAIPHHTVSSTQSSSRSKGAFTFSVTFYSVISYSFFVRKGNYDYVQPGARLAPSRIVMLFFFLLSY